MKQKVHSLTGRITPQLVYAAWRAVRGNRGAAGIDKVSVQMFEKNLQPNLDRVMRELKDGTFRPKPARRVYIHKALESFVLSESRQCVTGLARRCYGAS